MTKPTNSQLNSLPVQVFLPKFAKDMEVKDSLKHRSLAKAKDMAACFGCAVNWWGAVVACVACVACVAVSEAFDVVTKTQSEGTRVQWFQRSETFRDFQGHILFFLVICGSTFVGLFWPYIFDTFLQFVINCEVNLWLSCCSSFHSTRASVPWSWLWQVSVSSWTIRCTVNIRLRQHSGKTLELSGLGSLSW